MSRINNGAPFPDLGGLNLDSDDVSFRDLIAESWGLVLFYRGHW